jgi:hypothetical protein
MSLGMEELARCHVLVLEILGPLMTLVVEGV